MQVSPFSFLSLGDIEVKHSSADRFLYYDQPEYDPFWRMAMDLDVPVYLHPRVNAEPVLSLLYKHAPWLKGPTHEYAATLSTHILGLCTNGVFECVLLIMTVPSVGDDPSLLVVSQISRSL